MTAADASCVTICATCARDQSSKWQATRFGFALTCLQCIVGCSVSRSLRRNSMVSCAPFNASCIDFGSSAKYLRIARQLRKMVFRAAVARFRGGVSFRRFARSAVSVKRLPHLNSCLRDHHVLRAGTPERLTAFNRGIVLTFHRFAKASHISQDSDIPGAG